MNIEQMLRDAIERKTAKILKEEYGIEMSKTIADKLSEDGQDYKDEQGDQDDQDEQPVYQVTLLEAGENDEQKE